MKIDFKSDKHLSIKTFKYHSDIIIHSRRVKNIRLITPDKSFVSVQKLRRHYNMTKSEVHEIFDNLDTPRLSNSKYFPELKVGVIPKYIGFKNATYYTGT